MDRFETFVTSVTTLYRLIQKIKDKEMTEFGLKGTHVMCLYMLHRHPEGLSLTRLSVLCDEDKAATSRAVAALMEKGYLCYAPSESSTNYRAAICLTEQGKQITARIDEIIDEVVERAGEGLDDAQRTAFYDALEKIAENLKEIYAKEPQNPA